MMHLRCYYALSYCTRSVGEGGWSSFKATSVSMETKDKGSELSGFVYTINRQLHVGIVKILQPGSKIGGPRLKDQGSRSDHSADYPSCSSHVPFPRRHSPSASEAKTCTHMPPPWRGKRNSRSGNDNVGHLVPKPQPSLSVDSRTS